VVYRDGGGWTDIASRIDQGLGYTSVEEAARTVRSLLNDSERLRALSAKAKEVAKGFSYERFKERVNEVIRLLTAKGLRRRREAGVHRIIRDKDGLRRGYIDP